MLSQQQIETIQGITCNYDNYVVYYYADYHSYTMYEDRDSKIIIYVGNDDAITYDAGTFYFSGAECYELTYSKYLTSVSVPASFTVPSSEMVYTNLVDSMPSIAFLSHSVSRFDFSPVLTAVIVGGLALALLPRIFFGRN